MVFDFLQPLDPTLLEFISEGSAQALGHKTDFHADGRFPDLESAKIAIIGVLDDRGGGNKREHHIHLN